MRKRGQFLLIAALIIAVIVFGIGTIFVSTKTSKEDITLFDLSDEISFEGGKVVDNGIFTGGDIQENVLQLSLIYKNLNPNSDIIILYGNRTLVNLIIFEDEDEGEINSNFGGNTINLVTVPAAYEPDITQIIPTNNMVTLTLLNSTYEFDVREGQNLYLIVIRERGGETFVAQG